MNIVGHAQNLKHLKNLAETSQLAHALLFTGPSGIGKKRVALSLAQFLFCEDRNKPCGNCPPCRKLEAFILSGDSDDHTTPLSSHPDLIWIEPEKDLIKIDTIRSLKSRLALQPFEAPLKIAVLADAHALNPAASNALLKTLEEPPPHTLLILITSSPHQLLKTILSRCQKVYFSPLTTAEAQEVIRSTKKEFNPELLQYSEGSPGQALSLTNEAYELTKRTILPALASQPKDLLGLLSAAEKIADDDSLQQPVLHLLRVEWRNKLLTDPRLEDIKKFDAIESAARALNQYANPLLTFENLFLNLCL